MIDWFQRNRTSVRMAFLLRLVAMALGALRLQIKSGVEHEHVRAAGEQRPGAGDAHRTGTDNTRHNFSLPGNAVAEWKQNLVRVQADSKTKSGAAFPHSA